MRTVFLTGACGGLGMCLTELFLKEGYGVFAADRSADTPKAAELKKKYGEALTVLEVDVTSTSSVEEAAKIVEKQAGKLDAVINAAGILPANSAKVLEEFDIDAALPVFDVNSLGPLRVVKAMLPLLEKGTDKIIVNISSEAGSMTTHANYTFRYDYCMSKAAVNMQTIILQRYLKPRGIKLLAVHPGWMHTRMGGAEAPVAPEDSAAGIYGLMQKYRGKTDGPIYLDYDGTPRAW